MLAGCGQQDVQVYQVDKKASGGANPGQAPNLAAGGMPAMGGDDRTIQYTLPPGWFNKPGDAMRVASFGVTNTTGQSADISAIPLGGMAGGDLSNVNRWRGQVGLPAVKPEELEALWEKVPVGPLTGRMVDLAGTNPAEGTPSHLLAVVLTQGDTTWFFKMLGGNELVTAQKPNFLDFLKSIKFGGGQLPTAAAAMPNELPAGHPPLENPAMPKGHPPMTGGAGAAPAAPVDAGPVALPEGAAPAPAGWLVAAPKSMQKLRFSIKGGDGEAEATLSELGGDGGGTLPNVNRWRQQIGLGGIDADALAKTITKLDVKGSEATVADMTNDANHKRVVAVIVPKGGMSLFFKLMGDAAVVGREKDKFLEYVRSGQ